MKEKVAMLLRYEKVRYGTVAYTARCDIVRYGTVQCGRYGIGTARYGALLSLSVGPRSFIDN